MKYGGTGTWRQVSRFHQLSDSEISECVNLKSNLIRGHQFDTKTKFLVLKIAQSSHLFNAESVLQLRHELKELSVAPKHYQIDGDWYLYIFLSDFVSSDDANLLLSNWCDRRGYSMGRDGLEIYPTTGTIPFPLQQGFAWINEKCQIFLRREEMAADSAIALFVCDVNRYAADSDAFLTRLQQDSPTQHYPCSSLADNEFWSSAFARLEPAASPPQIEHVDVNRLSGQSGQCGEPETTPLVVEPSFPVEMEDTQVLDAIMITATNGEVSSGKPFEDLSRQSGQMTLYQEHRKRSSRRPKKSQSRSRSIPRVNASQLNLALAVNSSPSRAGAFVEPEPRAPP